MAFGRIGIVGAGAWGTALAVAACRAGREVILQAHEPEVAAAINDRHENPFLAGVHLAPEIQATTRLAEAVATDAVLLVAPAQFLRSVCVQAAPHWPSGVPAVICAKGIEQGSGALMTQAVGAALPQAPLAVLSGPSFAAEVARGLPTAVTLAARDVELAKALGAALTTPTFRVYASDDPIGAQLGGAVKNVLAIGCGIVEGRGLGDNARAALITRGLAEITHLGTVLGARPTTFMGLSGLGDLVLTCGAMQSRNFSLGVALGEGRPLAEILSERKSVAEGVYTAASVMGLAARLGVDMPICGAVNAVLNRGVGLDEAIHDLLARPVGWEFKGDS